MSGSDINAEKFLAENSFTFINPAQLEEFQSDIWGSEEVNQWLLDFIISNKDKYVFGVISNNFKEAESILLQKFKVPEFYTIFVSSDDVGVLKPDKKIYEYALSKVDFAPDECLFIDDSKENIRGATECGMKVVQFTDNQEFREKLTEILV